MAAEDKKTEELVAASTLDGTELIHIVQGGNSRKALLDDILTLVATTADAWHTGSGAPSGGLGSDGDFYLDQSNGDVYQKVSGSWGTPVANITGPSGDDGVDGDDGDPAIMSVASTGTVSFGTGSKTWTYTSTPNLGLTVGMRVRATDSSGNWMEGTATAVSDTSITLSVNAYAGTASSSSSWTIGISSANPNVSSRSSTSSLTIGTGSKSVTYSSAFTNTLWAVGSRVRLFNDASKYMEGVVTAASSTGVTVDVDYTVGSGTYSSWTVLLAGDRGTAGTGGSGATTQVTSATSRTINMTAGKVFAFSETPNPSWQVGQRVRVQYDADSWMEGPISAISTGSITVDPDAVSDGGSTYASWTITLANPQAVVRSVSSTTSRSIGTGSKTFGYSQQAGALAWIVGHRVRARYDDNNWMEGVVTSISTTQTDITVDKVKGSGTYASWTLFIVGEPGVDGAAGASFPAKSINPQTGTSYNAVNGDFAGNVLLTMNNAGAITLNINTGLTNGEPLHVMQLGAGQITVAGSATLRNAAGLKTRAQYSLLSILPIATNEYVVFGDTTT